MWLFGSGLVFLVYIGINIYTGLRLFKFITFFLPAFKAYIFWPLYIVLCCSFMWVMFLRFDWMQPIRQVALNAFPAFVYFFFFILVVDLVWLVLRLLKKIPSTPTFSAALTGLALSLTIIVMIYGFFNARNIRTVYYSVTLQKSENSGRQEGFQPEGFRPQALRLALVSDLHIGATVGRKWTANIVDAINATKPDIVCMAGDIFDNDLNIVKDLEGVAAELRRLEAPLGVYACPGNHDVDRMSLRFDAGSDRIEEFLKSANVVYLQDDVELVADRFYLVGRKDARPIGRTQERKSAAALAVGLDATKPLIFMDHQPVDFPRIEEAGADLILSGHTHKGQFFPGNVFTYFIYKNSGAVHYGYWKGASAQGFVSSGAGVWGPAIRVATKSEIAVIDVSFLQE